MEDQIKAMTTKLYIPKAVDNIFNSNFFLSRLRKNQRTYSGGTSITVGLEYAELASAGSFSGTELLDTEVNDIVTQAEYEWRHYYVVFGWSRSDYLKNMGSKEKVIDLVSTSTKAASKKMQKNLTTGLFQTSKAKSTDIDGLIVATCAASTTECGGLSSSNFSTWAAQRDTSTTKLSLAALNTQERAAGDGDDRVSIWVTTDTILGYFYDISTPLMRYASQEALKAGFEGVMTFNGKPFVADKNQTASYIHGINENHFWMFSHTAEDMRYEPNVTPLNQAASLGKLFWFGNVGADARRRHVQFSAIAS